MESVFQALLSFDPVLTTIFNNVWACMAILTAGAISFIWTTNQSYSSPRFRQASSPSVSPQKRDVVHSCSPQSSEPVSHNIVSVSTPALDCADGVMKGGKFVVYYYDDEVQQEDYIGNEVFEETEYKDVGPSVKFWCRDLDMGWYRYLDSSVFSGNVVRLWD